MVRRLLMAAVLLVAGAAMPAACTIVTGLRVPPPDAEAPPPIPTDPCPHAYAPSQLDQYVGGKEDDLLFAVNKLDLRLDEPAPATFGFDLDESCTCTFQPPSCISKLPHCDDDAGRDNSGHALFKTVNDLFPLQPYVDRLLDDGRTGLLIRVKGYNGLPNDSNVTVSVYLSNGPEGTLDDGGTGRVRPHFDVTDKWTIDTNQLLQPFEAKESRDTTDGWVKDGFLVVRLSARVRLLDGPTYTFNSGIVAAKFVDKADGKHLEGLIAGRLLATDIFRSLGWTMEPISGKPFCEIPAVYDSIRPLVCEHTDVTVNSALDRTDAPCTAISAAISFEASPASFGTASAFEPVEERCADAGVLICDP